MLTKSTCNFFIRHLRNGITLLDDRVAFTISQRGYRIECAMHGCTYWGSDFAGSGGVISGFNYNGMDGTFASLQISNESIRVISPYNLKEFKIPTKAGESEEMFFQQSLIYDMGEFTLDDIHTMMYYHSKIEEELR